MVAVCLLLIAAVIGGLPVYVRPQIDPLRHADAILILGGDYYGRYPFGFDLASKGWAPTVAVSNPNGPNDPWLTQVCATPHPGLDLHCFVPDPPTTKGEGAGTAPFGGAIRVADGHRRDVPATDFPGPVHPGALLRR